MPIQPHTSPAVPRARRSLRYLIVCVLWPLLATLAHADAVTDWNETAIRAAASVGISTGWQSRIVAIAHAAMFDAVNSIEREYTTYAVEVSPPAGASAEVAATTAAHAVLTHLVPDQKTMLDAAPPPRWPTWPMAQRKTRARRSGVRSRPRCSSSGATTASTPRSRTRRAPRLAPGIRRRPTSERPRGHILAR